MAREEVVYELNGETVDTYTAAEVMGNPLNALVWLANHLATRGFSLEPGDIVMSGAITKMCDPRSATRFEPSSHTSARSASQWCPETALRDPPSKCSEDGRGQARMECVADRLSSCCRT